MKKEFYYDFLPSKKEELAALAINRPYQVTRTLVEIRDSEQFPPPQYDPNNPWRIRKTLELHEATTGKIHLSHDEVFEHIFRWWPLEIVNHIVTGNKYHFSLVDVTDHADPVSYPARDEETFLEKGLRDGYVLGLSMTLVRSRGFKKDDEVAIFFDPASRNFYFKILRE